MTALKLSPLPSSRPDPARDSCAGEADGFVDDAVVLSLLRGPVTHRNPAFAGDLALAADGMDFAGWCLSSNLPSRATEAPARRAAPPVLEETGIGPPHAGSHRWWLAGVAGAFSTMLASLLLFTLGSRNTRESLEFSVIQAPKTEQRTAATQSSQQKRSPELTGTPIER
jgi:hypothetical protein